MLSILKLVSFESLAGNEFSERGTQPHCEGTQAHCGVRKPTATEITIASCEVLDEEYHIALQGIYSVGIIINAGGLR